MDDSIKQKVRFSLKYKFFILIGLIISFVIVSLVSFFLFKTKRDLEREVEKRGLSEIKGLAYDVKYGVLTENLDIIDSLVIGRLGKPDIVYVEITGEDNIVLSSMAKEEYFNAAFSKDYTSAVELGEGIYKSYFSVGNGSEKGYEFTAPILTEQGASDKEDAFASMWFMMGAAEEKKGVRESSIGRVKIGLSLKNIKEQMLESLLSSVAIIFVVLGMSMAISNFFINIIVRPIRKVAQTAIEIAKGDLSKRVDVKLSDEIGVMADNFNRMTESLRCYIKELEDIKKGLEEEVEKRACDLKAANAKLEMAYGDLKKLDEAKTDFLSLVSHELRTPLTSVLGFASLTRHFFQNDILPALPKDNKRVNKKAETISNNLSIVVAEGERLTRLINDVLDIARIEAGKVEWHIKEVNIIDLCRQAISAVAGYPKSDQVEVFFEAPEVVRPVKGDPDRLLQVITNLMSNAFKFTEKGDVTLKVEPGDENVKVVVSDTGLGIMKQDIDAVFEKFKQVGDVLKDKPKGTGLGLPICKEIIKYLGGEIWAESEIGKGSRFCFTIDYWRGERRRKTAEPIIYHALAKSKEEG